MNWLGEQIETRVSNIYGFISQTLRPIFYEFDQNKEKYNCQPIKKTIKSKRPRIYFRKGICDKSKRIQKRRKVDIEDRQFINEDYFEDDNYDVEDPYYEEYYQEPCEDENYQDYYDVENYNDLYDEENDNDPYNEEDNDF